MKVSWAMSQHRINMIRAMLKERPRTLAEIANETGIGKDMVRYYIRQLEGMNQVREAATVGSFRTKVYQWIGGVLPVCEPPPEPEPESTKIENPTCTRSVAEVNRAVLRHGPQENKNTLTRWVGDNPFKKYRHE